MKRKAASRAGAQEKTLLSVIGRHVFGNLYDVDESLLKDIELVRSTVVKAAEAGNMHVVDIVSRQFSSLLSPDVGGVSVVALIMESHISIHTWPESRYVTVDIYSCGKDSKPGIAFDYILSVFKPKTYKMYTADRSFAN